jgi:outer membrane protein assembly factor BamD
MGIDTAYEYAKVSIDSKKEERFLNSIERYQDFLEKYPNSEFLKEAEQIFVKSREELAKFADQNKKDT